MKILVAVKRVIDYNVQVRVKEDGTGVVTDNVKMSTNPPDDNAIEEAVKIKESGKATEVVASSGLTMPKAIDLFNLKPKSPPVALPTTLPF